MADIVVNDASVRNVDPTNTGYANTFTVRGLILGNGSIALGGLFGLAPNNQTTLAGIERVEVMKGPTAFLNGMSPSGTAGAINLVPKRAGEEALTEFTASYLSDSQVGGHLDVGRRFGEDKQFGIRVNALLPGGTDTPLGRQVASTPETQAFVAGLHALKRLATPDEIARSALYLASDASSFTTGTALLADGGVSIVRV